jgi:hypothetical protein
MRAVGKVVVAKKVAGNRRDRKQDRREGDEKTERLKRRGNERPSDLSLSFFLAGV